jgi:lysophospholipase L1-like esterase
LTCVYFLVYRRSSGVNVIEGVSVQRPVVSRPAWINLIAGSGPDRKSPVELVATAASVITHSPYAHVAGLRGGRFGRWSDGVGAMRADCMAFAEHWRAHNERILAASGTPDGGPLWVVLGDSTAQGLGAPEPDGGYVGQALRALEERTGQRWRVLNLSVSGALIRDVLAEQLPALPQAPDLVTCGIGANDILYSAPAKLFSDLRMLLGTVPDNTVLLDLPIPQGFWGIIGRFSVPYITRINRVIHEVAADRGLPVAEVSAHFRPPWQGKFAVDSFHPSQDGYRDWARALLAVLPGTTIPAATLPGPAPAG